MLPSYVSDSFYQRDGYTLDVPFTDENDDPIDVSGSTFTAAVRGENGGIVVGTLAWAIDDTDAATGSITMSLAAADCMAITGPTSERDWPLIFDLAETGTFNKTICEGRLLMRTAP